MSLQYYFLFDLKFFGLATGPIGVEIGLIYLVDRTIFVSFNSNDVSVYTIKYTCVSSYVQYIFPLLVFYMRHFVFS